jgi:hypothetical protein
MNNEGKIFSKYFTFYFVFNKENSSKENFSAMQDNNLKRPFT